MKASINTCHSSIVICSFSYVFSILTINRNNIGERMLEGRKAWRGKLEFRHPHHTLDFFP
jgi:hypothetical protein